ncbi:hypothetical protein IWQ62_000803 [Dispira parvispora]|uniref:Uncharacterized protein n=1 Tax=Dispira parvispora TaxID=1520584 RepID=A0A9W8E995_9FUNG|nr:hypothetical protein IWQ62_000803 [Dispira parvispora]
MVFHSQFNPVEVPNTDLVTLVFDAIDKVEYWKDINRPVSIDAETGKSITVGEFKQQVIEVAAGWQRKAGLKRGQVVAIISPNDIHYSTAIFGTLAAGGVVTPMNPAYTTSEVVHQLKDSGAQFAIVDPLLWDTLRPAFKQVGIPTSRVYTFPTANPSLSNPPRIPGSPSDLFTLRHPGPWQPVHFTAQELATTPAFLCYSSGTTGRSKGVITTHRNMVANVMQIHSYRQQGNEQAEGWIIAGVLPFYHIYGLNVLMHLPIIEGGSVVIVRKFDLLKFLSHIEKYRIDFAYLVPPIILGLTKHPAADKYDLSSLKGIISGAAPLPPALSEAVYKKLHFRVRQGFGMTETSAVSHLTSATSTDTEGVGVLLPLQEAKIIDEDGKELGVNQPGELCLRGPNITLGYLNNPEANRNAFLPDGFMRTGDVVYADENGTFYMYDRIKELIKYKGFQVAPAELEALLLSHPKVDDVVVVGAYDEEQVTEVPRAYVVLRGQRVPDDLKEYQATAKELSDFVNEKVASHKKLRGGVEFIKEVPKSPSGKTLRRIMREQARQSPTKPLAAKL